MKAKYKYCFNMPKKHFKIIQEDCINLFNSLVDKEELSAEDWQNLDSYKSEMGFLPIPYTYNELESVILLRIIYNKNINNKIFNKETDWFLQDKPFKIKKEYESNKF